MKALPKDIRKQLFPLPEQVSSFLASVDSGAGQAKVEKGPSHLSGSASRDAPPFFETMRKFVQRRIGEPIPENAWQDREMPAHLRMNIRVVDDTGRELAVGRDLLALKGRLGQAAQLTFGQAEAGIERSGVRTWDFGDLPEEIGFVRKGRKLIGYPALVDEGSSVAVRLLDLKPAADAQMRAGVRRLLRIALKDQTRQLEKGPAGFLQAALQLRNVIAADDAREDLLNAISDRAFIGDDPLPRTQKDYEALRSRARTRLPAVTEGA